MPEGPELHFASKFINRTCCNLIFGGKVEKSAISKNPDIVWDCESYNICSKSRGKELMLTLTDVSQRPRSAGEGALTMNILIHFGMSGFFHMTPKTELPKHAHLKFHTKEKEPMTLSFVDTRRFGSWKVSSTWSTDRGPDPVFEYELFRENVLNNLKNGVFKKAICEVMLNQTYFNGIGNYLRAEILYRANVMPFSEARSVLENQCTNMKQEHSDILQLCHDVPLEAMNLEGSNIYDPNATKEDIQPFLKWLRCYENSSMNKMQDHNKRAIWFSGKPGPLAPKGRDSFKKRLHKPKNAKMETEPANMESEGSGKDIVKMNLSSPKKTRAKKGSVEKEPKDEENKYECPQTRSRTKIASL